MKIWNFKKWIKTVCCLLLVFMIISSATVIYVDPFFVYHKPIEGLYYPLDDVMYQGAGIVKNFDYEVLITGTSLVQNMKASKVKELFSYDAVKVPLCGISLLQISELIDLAISNNKDLKMVILNLDTGLLFSKKENDDANFPDYLYDNNYLNDINYLLNKSVAVNKVSNAIFNFKNEESENFDTAFSSEKQFYFAEFVVNQHSISENKILDPDIESVIDKNIQIYKQLIEKNPNIQFELIISPKSIMAIKESALNDHIDIEVNALTRTVESIISYDNVNIHSFQDNVDIIGNLYNYCDFQHFSSNVSDYLLECVKNKSDLLTEENYIEEILKIKTISETFDYSVFSSDAYPIKAEDNINEYLDLVSKNEKYEIYVSRQESEEISVTKTTAERFNSCKININNVAHGQGAFYQKEENSNNNCTFGENGEIYINNVDYSLGLPGVNIVVYDKELERVIDSVNFNGQNLSVSTRTKNIRKTGYQKEPGVN